MAAGSDRLRVFYIFFQQADEYANGYADTLT